MIGRDRLAIGGEHQAVPDGDVAGVVDADVDVVADPGDAAVGHADVDAALVATSGGLLGIGPVAAGAGPLCIW